MLEQLIGDYIESILKHSEENSIYVIKGIEFLDLNLKIPKTLKDFSFEKFIEGSITKKVIFSNLSNTLQSGQPTFLLYSELILLDEIKLLGNIQAQDYQLIIIDLNIFDNHYASFTNKNNLVDYFYSKFSEEKDNIVQKIFSLIHRGDSQYIYAYNEHDISFEKSYYWHMEIDINDHPKTKFSPSAVLSSSAPIIEMVEFAASKLYNNDKLFFSYDLRKGTSSVFDYIIRSLKGAGLEIIEVTQNKDFPPVKPKFEYVSILKRIDKSFAFRDITIYEDPAQSSTTINISQEAIIDEIYVNSLNAYNGESYNDSFITASTGAGKSIMFQIPAIKLAEEHKLLTLVITPLIGLMNDQVDNISKMTNLAATINSEYTPYEKDTIKEKIELGEISILYLSPETLLSNAEIRNIIGNRQIGLIVIDEAHTVATWGKSFRPDYWFLGDYIKSLRRGKNRRAFPIVAFTATATYGGNDDMYYDIIDSLSMNVKKPYIGRVIRDNIEFRITTRKKENDYRKEKHLVVLERVNTFIDSGYKTLVYFPYKTKLREISKEIHPSKKVLVGRYQGDIDKIEKEETLKDFKEGKKKVVLATKAFGMGIDVEDIKYVYHYAPTGNLADYIQEIGRAARKSSIQGEAITDYYEEDFRYINQLFGLSSIKMFEVAGVIRKILDIYNRQKTRNLLVSPEEFSHVFNVSTSEDIDGRLKTTLLVIKKDLEVNPRLENYALIFKPRSMFTKGLFLISDGDIDFFEKKGWMEYLTKHKTKEELKKVEGKSITSYVGDVYELDFKELWTAKYRDVSFGKFKYEFFEDKLKDIKLDNKLKSKILLDLEVNNGMNFMQVKERLFDFLRTICSILDEFKSSNKHFSNKEFAKYLFKLSPQHAKNLTQAELISSSALYLLNDYKFDDSFRPSHFLRFNSETEKYEIVNTTYNEKKSLLINTANRCLKQCLNEKSRSFLENNDKKGSKMKVNLVLIMAQMFELINVAKYKIKAGDRPEFFIRVNSESSLEKFLDSYYKSLTIDNIKNRHENSKKIMNYFFTQLNCNDKRWQLIEDYFLGNDISLLLKSND